MEISRLIFSKETKNKIEKDLNASQRGQLRWERVKESDRHGSLAMAKNRNEVANLAGFTKENKYRGYQWVSNMIARKHLQEVAQGIGKNGRIEYEYHVLSDPDYSREKARDARLANQNRKKAENIIKQMVGKEPNVIERGKVLFDRLKDLEKEGTLEKARSRADVATLVGYANDQAKSGSGYSWVSNLIHRGHLVETVIGKTSSGYSIYCYKLGETEPRYNYDGPRNKKATKKNIERSFVYNSTPMLDNKQMSNLDTIKIKVTRGDTSIDIEMVDSDKAISLITTILKGE